jgi:hypothetical protein
MAASAAALRTTTSPFTPGDLAQVELSCDPFDSSFDQSLSLSGNDPLCGLQLTVDPWRGRLQLQSCTPGTPAARMHCWRSRLRSAYLLAINDVLVTSVDDVTAAIATAWHHSTQTCILRFAQDGTRPSMSAHGIPQLYFDQLTHISQHLSHLRASPTAPQVDIVTPTAHKLTRRLLKQDAS